jgi:hypothetical protein
MLDCSVEESAARPDSRGSAVPGSSSQFAVTSTFGSELGTVPRNGSALVQNHPDQATKPMGNGPDSLIVSQAPFLSQHFGFHNRSPRSIALHLRRWPQFVPSDEREMEKQVGGHHQR